MTRSQSIINWFKQLDNVDISEIFTDELPANIDSIGLIKSPNSNYFEFSDGTRMYTEYFQFAVRKYSQTESERINIQQWLSNLEKLIYDNVENDNLPTLENGFTCRDLTVESSFYLFATFEEESIYQATIKINYTNF